ncbi:hypothetical protein BGZ96_005020, partial [Linnemannia gamsii]
YIIRLRLYMNVLLAEDPTGRAFLELIVKVIYLQGCPHITSFEMCSKAAGFDNIYGFGPRGATKGIFAPAMNNMRSHTSTSNSAPAQPQLLPTIQWQ